MTADSVAFLPVWLRILLIYLQIMLAFYAYIYATAKPEEDGDEGFCNDDALEHAQMYGG